MASSLWKIYRNAREKKSTRGDSGKQFDAGTHIAGRCCIRDWLGTVNEGHRVYRRADQPPRHLSSSKRGVHIYLPVGFLLGDRRSDQRLRSGDHQSFVRAKFGSSDQHRVVFRVAEIAHVVPLTTRWTWLSGSPNKINAPPVS
jgi:hypothetical protein